MDNRVRNNLSSKDNKHSLSSDMSNSINQIDTIGPLLAETYKNVKEMKKQTEEILKIIRRGNWH